MDNATVKIRGPRPKRAPRKDTRKKITIPLTDEQFAELSARAAGKMSVAELARMRLFGGRLRNQDVLRKVAALHAFGLQVKALAESRPTGSLVIQATLLLAQKAIRELAQQLPGPGDPDDVMP